MTELALFDFDGTLTRRDSLTDFLRHTFRPWRLAAASIVLAPVMTRYAFGRVEAGPAKERVLAHFYRGRAYADFAGAGEQYALQRLPLTLRPSATRKLFWHTEQRHEVVIVTASVEEWIRPWAEKFGARVIGTRLEQRDGRLTGRLATPNCKGDEKIRRILEHYDLQDFERIHAYGDSEADKPMLSLAHEAHRNIFRD